MLVLVRVDGFAERRGFTRIDAATGRIWNDEPDCSCCLRPGPVLGEQDHERGNGRGDVQRLSAGKVNPHQSPL
jgi:hypothetical protein